MPVRAGELPVGAVSVGRAAAGGGVLVVGDGTEEALAELRAVLGGDLEAAALELGPYAPRQFAERLALLLAEEEGVVLPGSPDGRDLAPRLAARLGWPLVANAGWLGEKTARVLTHGGRRLLEVAFPPRVVVTVDPAGEKAIRRGVPAGGGLPAPDRGEPAADDPVFEELLAADPAAVDLSEAERILAAGAGLDDEGLDRLSVAARLLSASVGATRVVTDAGRMDHRRQIGTTGVSVSPRLYVAFGVSGAAQHVAGLGDPEHVISVNTDPGCPMMAMADLALVSDAARTLAALVGLLEERGQGG